MKKLFRILFIQLILTSSAMTLLANENIRKLGQYVVTSIDTNSHQAIFIEPDEVIRDRKSTRLNSSH